ncbi:MAG: fused MFS/spermidine synthase [Phycisphaeraceae bacterium]|nr:fused MFS/spermidine synthase [Phycisphaeraceae bacterium]
MKTKDTIGQLLFYGISLCFVLSGAAGLVYQVAWGKSLGLIFGNTVYATATVLAVFMGGLALGSALLGRWAESRRNAIALYGWVELAVAVSGALSLVGLAGVHALYVETYSALSGSGVALVGLRFVGAAIVLLLPTFLMGGTLPILVKGVTRTSEELGSRVSRLYWVNTLGAVAGTFGSGFWLIPTYGLRRTVAVAVGLNILAGVIALVLSRKVQSVAPAPAPDAVKPGGPQRSATETFLLATFMVVGATAIIYEVCWTRLLATTIGSSTYAFTLMLGTFLVGIVLGSLAFEIWISLRGKVTLGTYAVTQTATALAALAFIVFFQRMPELVPQFLGGKDVSYVDLLKLQFCVSALAMLPTALVFGFNFPVVTLLIAGRPDAQGHGAAVGRAYAANTLGAIAGAVLAGFWLVPLLGSFRMVGLAAAANLLLALLLVWRRVPRRLASVGLQAVLLLLMGWVAVSGMFFNRDLAVFNAVLYLELHNQKLTLSEMAGQNDVVFAEDGLNANISVVRSEGYLSQRTNGKVDASNQDLLTQLLLGHVGAALHPHPKRVLVIGFGSGMTVAAVAAYPDVEEITVVEIEPAVIRAAPLLESLNHGVLHDPRVKVVLEDARSFLLTTRAQYDLIISEPSNPWIAGVATLFTDEYYREARARLAPGGIFVQWVQAYSLFPEDFRMVLNTLTAHFAKATLWRGEWVDYLLVGQTDPEPFTFDHLRAVWDHPPLQADFKRLGMSRPEGLLAFHRLDDVDVRKLIGAVPKNTDDHTRLEYNAPLALLAKGMESKIRDLVWAQRTSAWPRDVRIEDPNVALLAAAETLVKLAELDDAEKFLRGLSEAPDSAALALVRGRALAARGQFDAAMVYFNRALELDPDSLDAVQEIGAVAFKQRNFLTAERMFRQVLTHRPKDLAALDGLFQLERERENYASALEIRSQMAAVKGQADAGDLRLSAEICVKMRDYPAAEKYFRQLLTVEPYSYAAHRHLGEMLVERKDWEGAREMLEFVVRFKPDIESKVYRLLATAYENLGRSADADAVLAKGQRIFPDSGIFKKN